MSNPDRPACIAHWQEIEGADRPYYRGEDERMSIGAPFGRHFGLTRLGIHHERLLPGRRTSYPHAESAEEEFVYVIDGAPDVWLDGHLHRLSPGDAVGFPAGTGQSHTFINNTDTEVRLLVVGEASKPENRIVYPLNPQERDGRDDWWDAAPGRPLGDHDGLSDRVRDWRAGRRATQD
ncbi:cupin domain-containing protein [Defluviimonas sp. WL0024]|uniref:Cupin domain-containing protein n=2 Tax=Albidovulum TaxID=205889 RepID=A0ABT3J1U2_9RHOB|nr:MULTISPECIES: cupin domain-containing protein [Defluviimonas]MCU9847470.1 cupin domain-containing protein [Defluviimonas sp. WL0024]MCW3781662.1 cupin domain-containing protein [Defluviimonas salinarum]